MSLPMMLFVPAALADCDGLNLDNYFETSDGRCIDLSSLGSSESTDTDVQSAEQGLAPLRLGGYLEGFDNLEVSATTVSYETPSTAWIVTVDLQNLGTKTLDIAIIRYQVLQGDNSVYAGAIVPADGKLGPFTEASFEDRIPVLGEVLPEAQESLTVQVLETL
jgi:hypothetical protein